MISFQYLVIFIILIYASGSTLSQDIESAVGDLFEGKEIYIKSTALATTMTTQSVTTNPSTLVEYTESFIVSAITTAPPAKAIPNSLTTEQVVDRTSFQSSEYTNITSQAGTHAYLPCNVKQLVKKPISWIRVRDGHILTVDQITFIADQRFQSIYTRNQEKWSLQIKYVQSRDAGLYECQVSTEPKTSATVILNVVEPRTDLLGEPIRHVKAGSRVTLQCVVSGALEPPLFINWYFDRKQIFLRNQNGWQTEIDRKPRDNHGDKHSMIASLTIPSVTKKDSGNYTCSPSNSEPITTVLHVLNGEYSASAITSGSPDLSQSWNPFLILCSQIFTKILQSRQNSDL